MPAKLEVLEVLFRLEEFREKVEKGEITAGAADWVIRKCQAEVAHGHFKERKDWTAFKKWQS